MRVWPEIERLCRFTVWHLDPPFKRPHVRLLAIAGAIAVVALSMAVAWRLWARIVATASEVYSSAHAAANAIDGLDATEWLLPDAKLGWLQVSFPSPRALPRSTESMNPTVDGAHAISHNFDLGESSSVSTDPICHWPPRSHLRRRCD